MTTSCPQTIYLKDYTVPDYFIEAVDLEIDLYETVTIVKSHLTIYANSTHQGSPDISLHGESLILDSVSLNGKLLNSTEYKVTDQALIIYRVPTEFTLEITTQIKPQENTVLSGLYKSNNNFCTQCESEGFRRITYFLDRPDVMARYTTTIIADALSYPVLLSNGNLIASGKLENGKHWVRWEDPFKKPSYLFAMVAGSLECIEDYFVAQSGRKITLKIYAEKNDADKCAHAMQALKKSMRWDEENYGREYDLDIYMIVAVSDFNAGAMENKGLNIFNTQYILANPKTATDDDYINVESVIAHEYCHNWSGNRVTCRDWFQLSLKEGLTIFRDQGYTADHTSKTVARIHDVNTLRARQFTEDAGPLAHPVQPDAYIEISNFYTSTVYNKGAEVIRMIQTILGEKIFRAGMDYYFKRHDGQAVTIEDFVKAMEDASGIDLTQFRLWYHQAGTPNLEIQDEYDPIAKNYTLTIKQSCPPTPGQALKKPMHIPIKIGLLDGTGKAIPLQIHDGLAELETVLQIKDPIEIFHFSQIDSPPTPSLLRHFSAPVKVNFDYSDTQLQLLFRHDSDEFNRWEAGQKYAIKLLMQLIIDYQEGKKLSIPSDFIISFNTILQEALQDEHNQYYYAEMLMLPSEKYLAEQMHIIDVEAIHVAREFLLTEIAKATKDTLLEIYRRNHIAHQVYQFAMPDVARRRLKNTCLFYLMLLSDGELHKNIAMLQFTQALTQNMTDTMGALRCLVNIHGLEREQALAEFYQTWQNESLVVNKWFGIQALSKLPGTLETVKLLLQHKAFDLKNPNKVYALIGTFTNHNLLQFHADSGDAYLFLSEMTQKLDILNPNVSSHLVKPLTEWKRYDAKRQKLMRNQLESILQNKKISNNVYELASKSL